MAKFAEAPAGARGNLNSPEALPTTVEEVTTEWFTKVLGVPVKESKLTLPIHGTASKLLYELTYTNEADAASNPKNVCVKGGFMPELIKLHPGLTVVYRAEAEFWHYLAPRLGMRFPQSYFSGSDTVSGQGLVILEDLSKGYSFGEPTEAWPVDRVRAGVEQLALLHANTWGATNNDFPWMDATGGSGLHAVLLTLMSEGEWAARFADPATRPAGIPDYLVADRERMVRAFKTMWATHNPKFLAVAHGDPHIGNTFIDNETGLPGIIDWQSWMPNYSALHDVAYFIAGSLEIEDRRKYEVELLELWLECLHKAGAPKFTKDDVWEDYRKHMMHGFAWCLTNPMMQPKNRIDAMSARHCAAIQDHQSLELLESLPGYVTEA
ncbi:Protein kinase-like domain containing protein [Rhypophila decipiens]